MDASKPIGDNGRTYHLQTRAGDIAPHCLLVGSPERAEMIVERIFGSARVVGELPFGFGCFYTQNFRPVGLFF